MRIGLQVNGLFRDVHTPLREAALRWNEQTADKDTFRAKVGRMGIEAYGPHHTLERRVGDPGPDPLPGWEAYSGAMGFGDISDFGEWLSGENLWTLFRQETPAAKDAARAVNALPQDVRDSLVLVSSDPSACVPITMEHISALGIRVGSCELRAVPGWDGIDLLLHAGPCFLAGIPSKEVADVASLIETLRNI